MNRVSAITGVILAGGLSRRFGEDKAMVDVFGSPLLLQLLNLLEKVSVTPLVVVNTAARYAELDCERIVDVIPNAGPLGGVYTAFHQVSSQAVLVLTCDMPLLTEELLLTLLRSWRSDDEALVYQTVSGVMPFPGIYATSLKIKMAKALREGSLGVRQFLKTVRNVRKITGDFGEDSFFNMNTKEDFNILSQLKKKESLCPCPDLPN